MQFRSCWKVIDEMQAQYSHCGLDLREVKYRCHGVTCPRFFCHSSVSKAVRGTYGTVGLLRKLDGLGFREREKEREYWRVVGYDDIRLWLRKYWMVWGYEEVKWIGVQRDR